MKHGAPNRCSKDTKLQREQEWAQRAAVATEMKLQGKRLSEIGAALGVSSPVVSKLLKRWRQWCNKRAEAATEKWIARELARLDWLWRELCEAWQKSKRPRNRIKTREGGKDGALLEEVEEGQCGDPAIAGKLLEVHRRICELLGLDAPKRTEVSAVIRPGAAQPETTDEIELMDGSILPPAVLYAARQAIAGPNGNGNGHANGSGKNKHHDDTDGPPGTNGHGCA